MSGPQAINDNFARANLPDRFILGTKCPKSDLRRKLDMKEAYLLGYNITQNTLTE